MPAKTKLELLAVAQKEFDKLQKLISVLPAEAALANDADDTSIKDVIAHRAHWIDLFLGWYAAGMAGKEVHFPAKGYKWSELKRYNAALRAKQASIDWDEAKTMLAKRHELLMRFIQDNDDAALYDGPMKGAKNDWTPGRWAEAAGPSHYRSAAKYVRSRLKQRRDAAE